MLEKYISVIWLLPKQASIDIIMGDLVSYFTNDIDSSTQCEWFTEYFCYNVYQANAGLNADTCKVWVIWTFIVNHTYE